MKLKLLILLVILPIVFYGQKSNISGIVYDATTNEPIIGAIIENK